MNIKVIKSKEDLIGLKNKAGLAEDNILINISLSLYKEFLADENFCESDSIEGIAVRCPICGCSKFEGTVIYITKMTINDTGEPHVYKTMDGDFSKDIYCSNCGKQYDTN